MEGKDLSTLSGGIVFIYYYQSFVHEAQEQETTSDALSGEKALMNLVQCTLSFRKDFFYILIMELCMSVCCCFL